MTPEEFTAVLKLVHADLNWNYGLSEMAAGVVLHTSAPDAVKLIVTGKNAKDTFQRLVDKFLECGIDV